MNETGANAKRLSQEYDSSIIFTPHSRDGLALRSLMKKRNTSEPAVTEGGNSLTV
ncbi:hypothetical protein ACQKKK_12940 [Peribacillus sp. NPDC006672]|uniref:hypothetical protein n=1 Tax=Peribacillus sp. NPDC006672 TaxID=3390606 RepID=UPI003D01DB10